MMVSQTEENYLKSLLHLTVESNNKPEAGTNELASYLGVKPASANDMLKKLKAKKLVHYEKYGKISLTAEGRRRAIEVVRKHRLWETFLYREFAYSWDEVHEVAEQLEHIQSAKLVDKLDEFLKFPLYDPHGDPIPNAKGEMPAAYKKTLYEEEPGHHCTMVAVKDNSAQFLQYVNKIGLSINNKIKVMAKHDYDELMDIEVNGKKISVSPRFARNIVIVCADCARKAKAGTKKKRT
jgi:DtxR family transcriptional regulator, Mn-dependent transcriptional regulator